MNRFPFAGRRSVATSLALAVSLTLPLSLTMVGCGGGSSGSGAGSGSPGPVVSGQGRATFAVRWPERDGRLIPVLANSIVIVVKRADGQVVGNATLNRPDGSGAALSNTATIDPLPTGDLIATATAYPERDGTGVAQAAATAPLTIRANSNTEIHLVLQSTIDHLDVTTASGNASVGVAYTTQIAATARDADGNIVLTSPGKIRYELLSDPKIARFDTATGILTGIIVGEAQIRATDEESGKSDIVTVKVVRSAAYSITWISPLPGLPYIYPEAVNAKGEVVGICAPSASSSATVGFYWKPNADGTGGEITRISPPTGYVSIHPYSINDKGQVVGSMVGVEQFPSNSFLWENGKLTTLQSFGIQARDINASGQIVGYSLLAVYLERENKTVLVARPHLWNTISRRFDLLTFSFPPAPSEAQQISVSALAINNSSNICGSLTEFPENGNNASYAALWTWTLSTSGFSPYYVFSFPQQPTNMGTVESRDINASGQTAGLYLTSRGGSTRHGFVIDRGRFYDVGPLSTYNHTNAQLLGITNDGTAVGFSGDVASAPASSPLALRAIRWRYGKTEDLNALIPISTTSSLLQRGTAASGAGHLVGTGYQGTTHQAFILMPQGGTGGATVGVN